LISRLLFNYIKKTLRKIFYEIINQNQDYYIVILTILSHSHTHTHLTLHSYTIPTESVFYILYYILLLLFINVVQWFICVQGCLNFFHKYSLYHIIMDYIFKLLLDPYEFGECIEQFVIVFTKGRQWKTCHKHFSAYKSWNIMVLFIIVLHFFDTLVIYLSMYPPEFYNFTFILFIL